MTAKAFNSNQIPRTKIKAKKSQIIADFQIAYKSRLISNQIRKEVLNGKAKFGMEGAGKELLQIAMANAFQKGDFLSPYYREQTFMLQKELATIQTILAALYADAANDPFSGGRQMNQHYATPFIDKDGNWLPLKEQYNVGASLSSLAGQVPRALGLALASQKFRVANIENTMSSAGNEVSFCVLGDATTSEGVFFEAINAAGVMQVPIVFVIQDDGWGISVPTKYQTTKGSISEVLSGFESNKKGEGLDIYTVKAWDYMALNQVFDTAVQAARTKHIPCVIHVTECTQGNGHSTSGSHERYKPKDRLAWEKEMDCLLQFETWIVEKKWASLEELDSLKASIEQELKQEKQKAWAAYQLPVQQYKQEVEGFLQQIQQAYPADKQLSKLYTELSSFTKGTLSDLLIIVEKVLIALAFEKSNLLTQLKEWHRTHKQALTQQFASNLHSPTAKAAINIPAVPAKYADNSPMVNGYEVLNKYFDQLFERNNKVYAFGEDVGKIGGVNQCFAGLQEKYGIDRIFDTGIREWTIVGQGIGMAMRGLRPIAEIQYLDYLVYALPALTDELATLRWRSNGQQMAPLIVRTRGHRLEGIWHSGSPMGMLLGSLKGIYLLTPRNMTQAAGMYNTLLQSDDPAILIECLNGYRKKEQLPENLDQFSVPLGVPEVLANGTDISLITYGSCIGIAEAAIQSLAKLNISVELIDVQTLMPFDLEHRITESIKKTNRVVFLDEDVPGGGAAYMMNEVLEKQGAYQYLDAQPITITAKAHRTPYGDNGNYICKPTEFDVVKAIVEIMAEAKPEVYEELF